MIKDYQKIIDEAIAKQDDFNGIVSINDLSGNKYTRSLGIAERSFNVEVNDQTRFGIASGTKGFTAIKILQLIEDGKLSLTTSLNAILPGVFPNVSDQVTVQHLLMHTSGMPDYFDEEVMEDFAELWINLPMYNIEKPEDLLPLFAGNEMVFDPGAKFQYNNGGFIALGLIIEKITGQSIEDAIGSDVFAKANMQLAGFDRLDALRKNTALGYIKNETDGSWKTNIYSIPVKGCSDGGVFLNVEDMEAFWKSILKKNLIGDQSYQMFNDHHIHVSKNIYYSLGFWTKRDDVGLECIYLMGEDPGVSFMSVCYPKSGIFYTVQSNTIDGVWDIHFDMYENVLKLSHT